MEQNAELVGTEPVAPMTQDKKMIMALGDMNKLYVKDLVYFFNLFLGYVSFIQIDGLQQLPHTITSTNLCIFAGKYNS